MCVRCNYIHHDRNTSFLSCSQNSIEESAPASTKLSSSINNNNNTKDDGRKGEGLDVINQAFEMAPRSIHHRSTSNNI